MPFQLLMKSKWCLLVICLSSLLFLISGEQSSVVPYAINEVIKKHFLSPTAKNPGIIDIMRFGKEIVKFKDLLKIKSGTMTKTRFYKFQDDCNSVPKNIGYKLNEASIVLFGSKECFKALASRIVWNSNKAKRHHHLVYAPGLTSHDVAKTFSKEFYSDGFRIDHVSFLVNETEKSIDLVSGFMFTEQACHQLQVKKINHFSLKTMEWENSIFYPKKYENFHGCELTMVRVYGDIVDLHRIIFQDHLNATVLQCSLDTTLNTPSDVCDLVSSQYPLYHPDQTFLIAYPHRDVAATFLISPGEPYTDLERMFMMFDDGLWIAIGVTLIGAASITLGLNFVSRRVKTFIAGRGIHSPTMNLISIFLNGAQARVPGESFARFLVILFIIWSMIIRTCHQSMLFKILQADLRKPTVKTLDEFFESNLTLFLHKFSVMASDESFRERMNMTSTK